MFCEHRESLYTGKGNNDSRARPEAARMAARNRKLPLSNNTDSAESLAPPETKSVWQLAWPNIISNLLMTTVGFVHIKIVSELGTEAVAAVTTGHRIFFVLQVISIVLMLTTPRAQGLTDHVLGTVALNRRANT